MPTNDRICLTLELEPGADPIAGTLRDGDGHAEVFSGWMALTRAIELTLAADRSLTEAAVAVARDPMPERGRNR